MDGRLFLFLLGIAALLVVFFGGGSYFGIVHPPAEQVPITNAGDLHLYDSTGNITYDQKAADYNLQAAQVYKTVQEGNATILNAQGEYEVDHATACDTYPWQEACLPPGTQLTPKPQTVAKLDYTFWLGCAVFAIAAFVVTRFA